MLPLKIKKKALYLRAKGHSIKEIADRLHISKCTSSLWVRNVKLNEKAQQKLEKRKLLKYYKTGLRWEVKRSEAEQQRELEANKLIDVIRKDPVHAKLYCSLLYWCEGGKTYRESVRFINSDPILIETFLKLFRKAFVVDETKFRVLMHLHDYHNEAKQKRFWSRYTKINGKQFLKTFHKSHTGRRIKENYPGCVGIYYHDYSIARELRTIYKVFFKHLGAW